MIADKKRNFFLLEGSYAIYGLFSFSLIIVIVNIVAHQIILCG